MNGRAVRTSDPRRVSTPGRVCLFGEHQDYLGLPVISAAISLRLTIDGRFRPDRRVRLKAPDIGRELEFDLDAVSTDRPPAQVSGWRKFILAGIVVLMRRGYTFSRGFECVVRGNIPIRGGTSSSSAMVVSWIGLLARMSDSGIVPPPGECAMLAHQAEVLESGGVGGQMDQYATAVGGVLFQDFEPATRVERLPAKLGTFVLGDSCTQKDTQGILARVKDRVLAAAAAVREREPGFSLRSVSAGELMDLVKDRPEEERKLLRATVRNRDITARGRALLELPDPPAAEFGAMLNEQQRILAEDLEISTAKIDAMIAAALDAGASGGKINGSGGGGCMFAYAPDDPGAVAGAIASRGGTPYIVTVDEGTREEPWGGSDDAD